MAPPSQGSEPPPNPGRFNPVRGPHQGQQSDSGCANRPNRRLHPTNTPDPKIALAMREPSTEDNAPHALLIRLGGNQTSGGGACSRNNRLQGYSAANSRGGGGK